MKTIKLNPNMQFGTETKDCGKKIRPAESGPLFEPKNATKEVKITIKIPRSYRKWK